MERMGASDLFNRNANLTDFSESTKLKCLDIEHKAKIEIDETGTTAAAITPIYIAQSMGINFNCNHPFMFIIYDEEYKEILFAGIYRGPNEY